MFLYYVKTDYLLGTDPNKMDDSMNQFYSDTRSSREIIKGESTKEPLINPSPIASQSRNIIQPSDDDYQAAAPDKLNEDQYKQEIDDWEGPESKEL